MRHIRPRFHNPCGIYSRSSAINAENTAGTPQTIISNKITNKKIKITRDLLTPPHFLTDTTSGTLVHIHASCFFTDIYCKITNKSTDFFYFTTFQCDIHSGGFRSPCGIQLGAAIYAVIRPEFRNPCGIYGRDSAIHAAIRPGPPQPMRLLFPHTKFRKYLINKVFPK